ncbi:tryptophan-rich sensory protein [Mesobacillus zeae]|nr:tryptophan-rich sensory protein [Mesobacillus zeae]
MSILLAMITLTAYQFDKVDKPAGAAMVPYILWLGLALGLNAAIWELNR